MKNKIFTTLTLLCLGTTSVAQVGIGTDTPNDAAILEIKSTDKGILLPRLESSKISSLDNVQGLMVYCTDCDGNKGVLKINNGSEWVDYVPASGGSFSGNVGIGTSSPGMLLEVDASGGLANDVARFSGKNSAGLTLHNATADEFILHTATSDALVFGTNGDNERMRIDANGKVTIKGDLQVDGNSNLLRTEAFTAWLTNETELEGSNTSSVYPIKYTNVKQNSDDSVFSMDENTGTLTINKAGVVTIVAGFTVQAVSVISPMLIISVNDDIKTVGLMSRSSQAENVWMMVPAHLIWKVEQGDLITFKTIPREIGNIDDGYWSSLSVSWVGY